MDLRKLKTLIDLVSESNVSELEITEAEGRQIVKEQHKVDHKHRVAAAGRRMNQRRKQATDRESQKSQSAPTSRPANTSIEAVEVA